MPNVKKLGFDTFKASRIPNAIFVDIDKIKDDKSPYPHMLPNATQFQSQVSRLGIRNNDHLVMYDQIGNFSVGYRFFNFSTEGQGSRVRAAARKSNKG